MSAPPRVYIEAKIAPDTRISLAPDDAHYLRDVMRLAVGGTVRVFNGDSGEFECTVESAGKRDFIARAIRQLRAPCKEIRGIELAFAPIRHARLDFLFEKAAELGATVLSPVLTSRTAVKNFNPDHAKSVVKEAVEQCGRLTLPTINPLITLEKFIAAREHKRTLVFLDERESARTNDTRKLASADTILIGPEGGFSPDEFALLESAGAIGVHLQGTILRAETAAITALALHTFKEEK
ncbi:MAG: 16S rRNA (uracil(1498)-N(3))-methyltransferase [Rickettsiales bacterium]|jgi:16S rRNA (uracil1498-N3)-methyltransferase|nr:16S rRNA (uracil(1498)-N(3))-methyltransferase [Rickettsiales bacterium]